MGRQSTLKKSSRMTVHEDDDISSKHSTLILTIILKDVNRVKVVNHGVSLSFDLF